MNLMECFSDHIRKYHDKKNIEIEIRLGKLNHNVFDTNVGNDTFQKVLEGLKKYNGWEKVEHIEDEVFYWSGNIRCIYDGNNAVYQKKSKILRKDLGLEYPLDVRLSIAQEIPCGEQTTDAIHTVSRRRMSFLRKNVRIDMTVVVGQPLDKDVEEDTKYQIELEILDATSDQKIYSALYKVLNILDLLK